MKIRKGITKPKAYRVVVYGTEGVGKTTLASRLPDPLFIDLESGTHGLYVSAIDTDDFTFEGILGLVNELTNDHQGYRTLVIDSIDVLEKRFTQQVCDEAKADSIEKVAAYGKGYVFVKDRFGKLLDKLSSLVDSGMNVVFIGHSQLKVQTLPDEQGAFDRYELKLQKQIAQIVKEWCDTLLFCNHKTIIVTEGNKEKGKAQGGKRWVWSEHRPAFDAKRRISLDIPEECSIEKATDILSKALAGTETKKAEPKPEPKPEPKAEATPVKRAPAPHIAKLFKSMNQYQVTEEQIKSYSAPRLKDKFGMENVALCDYPEPFCAWLVKGMDRISAKIKGE